MKKGATLSFPEEPLSPLISRRGEKKKKKKEERKKGSFQQKKKKGTYKKEKLDRSGAGVDAESCTYLALRGLLSRSVLGLAVRVRC